MHLTGNMRLIRKALRTINLHLQITFNYNLPLLMELRVSPAAGVVSWQVSGMATAASSATPRYCTRYTQSLTCQR